MKVLYAGSFNPFHIGHQHVYDAACRYFGKDNVWLGVGVNKLKIIDVSTVLYSLRPITNNVTHYYGLTTDIAKEYNFDVLVRGFRIGKSIEYEESLLHWNKEIGAIETILIPTPLSMSQVSSSAIRELDSYDSNVNEYVHDNVYWRWKAKIPTKTVYFGQTCSGKTTFLKNKNAVNVDKVIWNYLFWDLLIPDLHRLGLKDKEDFKRFAKYCFNRKYRGGFDTVINLIGNNTNWRKLFDSGDIFDMAVIGSYWNYIPADIRGQLKLAKVMTSQSNRLKFAKSRGLSDDFIKCSDFFYKDPPYWDGEETIEYV